MTAQDRGRRVPLGALLFLLSLFLTSGAAASAGNDLREPFARLGPSRQGTAAALLQSGNRNNADDETLGIEGGASVPPCGPGIVTELLWARPLPAVASIGRIALPRPAGGAYRARAPPAA